MLRSLNKTNNKKQSSFFRSFRGLLVVVGLFWGIKGEGQQAMERVYADNQTNGGTPLLSYVNNEDNAVDHNTNNNYLETYSTLGITVLGTVWQQLNFPEQAPTGTPVRIKVGTATDLLSLLGNIKAQAYMGNTAVGNDVALSSLLSLLGGEDQDELVFVPTDSNNSPVAYNAVRITYSGVALGGGFRIYEAYFYKPIVGQIACDEAVDVLYGSDGNIVAGVNNVVDAYNAIDNNDTTYATIYANVGVANKTHVTALFPMASSAGNFVKIIIEDPGGGLLDANVLATNFSIRTYLDHTDNGTLAYNSALLRLELFPGSSNKYVLIYPINQSFNRVQVSLEGLVTTLGALNVYEISRLAKGPDITGLPASGDMEVCEGDSINLSIENPETGTVYNWYTQPTGGTSFTTGMTYNPVISNPGDYTYYVSATKSYCTDESDRTPINIKVKPIHGHAEISISNIQD